MMNVFYITAILFLMTLSFLFSGCETGVYRLSRFRLRLGVEQKRSSCERLFQLIQDGQNVILSILLGNNLVNYLMTMLFTYIVFSVTQNERTAELYSSVVLTPSVFVFCEMMPKSIFYHKADNLMPPLSLFLKMVYSFFMQSGLLRIFKCMFSAINRVFAATENAVEAVDTTQRLQVFQIIHETQEEGLLSDVQKDMIHRLIHIPDISVNSVMVPLAHVEKVPLDANRQELLNLLQKSRFSRHLVYDSHNDHIIGYISLTEVLGQVGPVGLDNYINPLTEIDRNASVIEAISLLRTKREKIALVTEHAREKIQPVGVVTTTDLVEELIGEVRI